ncbi:MAG TPA: Uma2 family endonuclease [Chloroflexota bacterium]|nr:Uma2 family endonuclease [Chloroflexota bacterium]
MALTERQISLDEFLKMPEEKPALEYFDGMVTQKVSPKSRHSLLQGELVTMINSFARPQRTARALPELRVTFAGVSTVPDIAVLRWDRVLYDEKGFVVDDVFQPPDVAIEIISPEQSTNALIRKSLWYVANGVETALLADPDDESILAFHQGREPGVRRGSDSIGLDEVLPGFPLTVTELFQSLRRS